MLGDLITRGLILFLGYAYPAFECFKTMEKNRVQIEELRFWCQYWILVAVLTVLERIGDTFISWLPMYGEVKLALFIYLWYPKTKGSEYVYETFLRPFLSKREPEIGRNLQELRVRAWDLAIYYWQNCTELGQTKFFDVLDYLTSGSGRFNKTKDEKKKKKKKEEDDGENKYPYPTPSAPPLPPDETSWFPWMSNKHKHPTDRRRPSSRGTVYRSVAPTTPESTTVQVHLPSQTGFVQAWDEPEPAESEIGADLHATRPRFRSSKHENL